MNNSKLIKNFFYQASYQVLLIILPIVSIPIVSRALGPSGLGTYNYISSIVNYFVLVAGLGIANYGVREISLAKKNITSLSEKFWEIQLFNMLFSSVVLFFYILFSTFMGNKILFLVQSMTVLASILDISWFFQGIEDFKRVTVVNALIKLLTFILIIVVMIFSPSLFWYTFIQSMSILLSALIFWFFLRKKIILISISLKKIFGHFKPAMNFFILKIAATLFINFNKTILGVYSTMSAVGIFSNSLTLVTMVGSIINTINIVLLPKMSELHGDNNDKEMIKVLEKSLHFQLFLTIPICFGIIAITPKMINWFFGIEFSSMIYLVPILAPIVIFQALHQGIASQFLVPKYEMHSYNITMILGTILNITLGVILVPKFNQYGAGVSFLLGQVVLAVSRTYVLTKKTNFSFNTISILKYLISSIIMFIVIYLLTFKMNPTIMTTTLQALIGIAIYFGLTTLLKANPILNFIE